MKNDITSAKSYDNCDLSIILPSYNAEKIILKSITELQEYINKAELSWEIIIVDDGSTDETARIFDNITIPNLIYYKLPKNRGKGKALATGIEHSNGKYCVFMDIDLPYELDVIGDISKILAQGKYQAVFGNRKLEKSHIKINLSQKRILLSNIFSYVVSKIIKRKDLDTQCGCKGFTNTLAKPLFQALTIDRFAFDVELCLLLTLSNICIKSLPVKWINNSPSTISIRNSGCRVFIDLCKIYMYKLLRLYDVTEIRKVKLGNNK